MRRMPLPASQQWLRLFEPRPHAALKLICFPYAGGTAGKFRDWQRDLPADVEVRAVQLPGREERLAEPPIARWADLVPALSRAVASVLDRRFAFFGHSLGAMMAFEVARWLRRHRSLTPECLAVSGCRAPHLPDNSPPIAAADDERFFEYVRAMNGTPREVFENQDLREVVGRSLRADFALVETYLHDAEPPLECSIAVFGGDADEESGEGRLEAWRLHTRSTFRVHLLPGDHFFLHSRQRELLELLGSALLETGRRPARAASGAH